MRARCCRELHLSRPYYNLVIWDARFSYIYIYIQREKRSSHFNFKTRWAMAFACAPRGRRSLSITQQRQTAPEHICILWCIWQLYNSRLHTFSFLEKFRRKNLVHRISYILPTISFLGGKNVSKQRRGSQMSCKRRFGGKYWKETNSVSLLKHCKIYLKKYLDHNLRKAEDKNAVFFCTHNFISSWSGFEEFGGKPLNSLRRKTMGVLVLAPLAAFLPVLNSVPKVSPRQICTGQTNMELLFCPAATRSWRIPRVPNTN